MQVEFSTKQVHTFLKLAKEYKLTHFKFGNLEFSLSPAQSSEMVIPKTKEQLDKEAEELLFHSAG